MDVFKAHQTPGVAETLLANDFLTKFVPANCTSELQPNDIALNAPLKVDLTNSFTRWYAQKVCSALKANEDNIQAAVEAVQPDLRLSVMKPIHAMWTVDAITALQVKKELIFSGWRRAGITATVEMEREAGTQSSKLCRKENTTKRSPDLSFAFPVVPTAVESTLSSAGVFHEHFLPAAVCQSRSNGRNGSLVCAVISALAADRILLGVLTLPV